MAPLVERCSVGGGCRCRWARPGGGNFKVLRMDGTPYPDEVHDYAEGLLVIDGELRLRIHGEAVTVSRGEVYVVPAGVPHSVDAGSAGTLVILDV